MKKYLIWPAFLLILTVIFVVYAQSSNCRDGLLIGSCSLGAAAIVAQFIISLFFYLISVSLIHVRARRRKQILSQKTVIIAGIVSLLFIPLLFLTTKAISILILVIAYVLANLAAIISR